MLDERKSVVAQVQRAWGQESIVAAREKLLRARDV